jgi:hypothetical protein
MLLKINVWNSGILACWNSVFFQSKILEEIFRLVLDPPLNLLQGEDFICTTAENFKCYLDNKDCCPLLGGEGGVGL